MRVLVVSPHADDETIGMGGTIARYAAEGHDVVVAVMTGHGDEEPHPIWPRETWDAIRAEAQQAYDILGVKQVVFREIPAARVSDQPVWKLNKITDEVLNTVRPDILYVPFPFDLHKDHRELFHSFAVAWRPCSDAGSSIKEIYSYEVMSETHWNVPQVEPGFLPNVWTDVSKYMETKVKALRCFRTQILPAPHARSIEAVRALAVFRGAQVGVAAAEAFVTIRVIR
ncbi:MAG: PIG-L deacetylase family protein [Desulfomonilaceae bacterium]|nr:PIG-L deacetylase family protein [Desulfomonilaceae bacterium]